jgi:hypothetical protein
VVLDARILSKHELEETISLTASLFYNAKDDEEGTLVVLSRQGKKNLRGKTKILDQLALLRFEELNQVLQ